MLRDIPGDMVVVVTKFRSHSSLLGKFEQALHGQLRYAVSR
jgi:hypothetical protein